MLMQTQIQDTRRIAYVTHSLFFFALNQGRDVYSVDLVYFVSY